MCVAGTAMSGLICNLGYIEMQVPMPPDAMRRLANTLEARTKGFYFAKLLGTQLALLDPAPWQEW